MFTYVPERTWAQPRAQDTLRGTHWHRRRCLEARGVRIGADPRQCDKHILWQAVRQVGCRAREQGKHAQQHRNKPTGSLKVFNHDGSSCHVLDF